MKLANGRPIPLPPRPWIVGLAGSHRPNYVPSYAPRYAPPQMELGDSSKRLGAIEWNEAPKSVLVASLGVGAIYVGGVLPSPADMIVRVTGIAAIGYAFYNLFTSMEKGPPTPPLPPEEAPLGERVPGSFQNPYPPGWLGSIIKVELDPAQSNLGGTWRNKYADQDYGFTVRNNSKQPLTFYTGLAIRDDWGNPMTSPTDPTLPGGRSPVGPTIYGRQEVKALKPNETRPLALKAPALGGFPLTSYNTTVAVELFRDLRDAQPFMTSDSISIQQTPPWYAPFG